MDAGSSPPLDAWKAQGVVIEEERRPEGLETAATVFLTGAACPFTCVFCDLGRLTLDGPTPAGALPAQLRDALERGAVRQVRPRRLKLYNASNFFEPRAVPPADRPAMAELLRGIPAVTVECHPRLVGGECLDFASRLGGRLEVAMGLETIHPGALPRLRKGMTLADFDAAAALLGREGIDVRAFVLVGTPFVPRREAAEWAVTTAAHAVEQGAAVVSLIPLRGGPGAPDLRTLEAALERAVALGPGAVSADLWDVDRLSACPACREARVQRLAAINRTGAVPAPIACAACAPA